MATETLDFRVNWEGEKAFDAMSFGFSPGQMLFSASANGIDVKWMADKVANQKTMVFTKYSDLVTVGLLDAFHKKTVIKNITMVVLRTLNEKTTHFWTILNFQKALIKSLQFRVPSPFAPVMGPMDTVTIEAEDVNIQSFDFNGHLNLSPRDRRVLGMKG